MSETKEPCGEPYSMAKSAIVDRARRDLLVVRKVTDLHSSTSRADYEYLVAEDYFE